MDTQDDNHLFEPDGGQLLRGRSARQHTISADSGSALKNQLLDTTTLRVDTNDSSFNPKTRG